MTAHTLPPEQLSPSTNRANRLVLLAIGLILLVGGVAALLTGLGVFGAAAADQPVLPPELTEFAEDHAAWFWPLIAVLAVLIGLLALRWLVLQGRSERVPSLHLDGDSAHGRTRLEAAALTGAVEDEIESYRGVAAASAQLVESSQGPRLSVRVQLTGRVPVGEVRRRVETEALDHARTALSNDHLPIRLELVVAR